MATEITIRLRGGLIGSDPLVGAIVRTALDLGGEVEVKQASTYRDPEVQKRLWAQWVQESGHTPDDRHRPSDYGPLAARYRTVSHYNPDTPSPPTAPLHRRRAPQRGDTAVRDEDEFEMVDSELRPLGSQRERPEYPVCRLRDVRDDEEWRMAGAEWCPRPRRPVLSSMWVEVRRVERTEVVPWHQAYNRLIRVAGAWRLVTRVSRQSRGVIFATTGGGKKQTDADTIEVLVEDAS